MGGEWREIQLRESLEEDEEEEEEGLHRPIVSPSTHKGRRRRGIISLVCQELWPPVEGESEQAGWTNNCSGCSCHCNRQVLVPTGVRRDRGWTGTRRCCPRAEWRRHCHRGQSVVSLLGGTGTGSDGCVNSEHPEDKQTHNSISLILEEKVKVPQLLLQKLTEPHRTNIP
ncbi:unnamed protein product [Pleuronectes platessa]|uniref:Uncharacterized protein n=1 Tax=Pleuronectes platessa TaxID=8262 RepID=A0A9N7UAR1_PLEPL|nr:unnamed protein product [Pleuronectes platessa]